MKPIVVITRVVVKPGMIEPFILCQTTFMASLIDLPVGFLEGRIYRRLDKDSVIQISKFSSQAAQKALLGADIFKDHLDELDRLVISADSELYDGVYAIEAADRHPVTLPAPSSSER